MGYLADLEGAITAQLAGQLPDEPPYPVAVLPERVPTALVGAVLDGIVAGLRRRGWDAVLLEATGAGVVWARPHAPPPADDADPDPGADDGPGDLDLDDP